jgi:hypothetical protein
MVQTDTGDQGLDVRKEQEKIVAYFEKDPAVNLWVTPDENGQLYVVCESEDDFPKTYLYEDVENFIDANPEKNGSSFQLFEWIDHSVSEFEVSEDIDHGDEEMIIEEKQMIDKSKKKRKEKAQGFEMT